jgi:hypothetical protein
LEDWHSIVFTDQFKFYGVMDGHFGARAAKYASTQLQRLFKQEIRMHEAVEGADGFDTGQPIYSLDGDLFATDAELVHALRRAFLRTHTSFLKSSPPTDISGTTATAAIVFKDVVVSEMRQ